jgi:tetratricopeptide (TPR) repeat protein
MKRVIFGVIIASLLLACNNIPQENKTADVEDNMADAGIEKQEIFALEDSLAKIGDAPRSIKMNQQLLTLSIRFADNYPNDEHSPGFLFMAARSANGLRQYKKSIKLLNRVIENYDDYDRLVEIYFLKAFTYDEDLDEKAKAKKAYNDLISRFPEDPLATESQILIDNLYLSDEDLIKKYNPQR